MIAAAEVAAVPDENTAPGGASDAPGRKPRRRPRVSADTPRERRELDPGTDCPNCGGALRHVGEDVSEMLDMITAQLKVIEIARLKKSDLPLIFHPTATRVTAVDTPCSAG